MHKPYVMAVAFVADSERRSPWLFIFPVRVGLLLMERRHWVKLTAKDVGANPTRTAIMNS